MLFPRDAVQLLQLHLGFQAETKCADKLALLLLGSSAGYLLDLQRLDLSIYRKFYNKT
jgi:hypothetical protein